jgi:hypothetical protein
MDGERFDRLTKHLADGFTRRRVLRGIGGAGAALATLGGRPTAAAPNACAQACAFEPKGPRQAACKQACKKCGQNLNQVCFGNTITCCADGLCCFDEATGDVTCSTQLPPCPEPLVREGCQCVCPGGNCGAGEFPDPAQGCACAPIPTCDSGGAPENCEAGVEASCADGACACVTNVDGGEACVERFCTFEACTSGADCSTNLCVDIPGCCEEPNPFCGVPCGSAAAGARSAGWQR